MSGRSTRSKPNRRAQLLRACSAQNAQLRRTVGGGAEESGEMSCVQGRTVAWLRVLACGLFVRAGACLPRAAACTVIGLAFAGPLSGCGTRARQPAATVPSAQVVYAGRPCAPLRIQSEPSAPIAVFLEVVDVEGEVGSPATAWLAAHAVSAHSVSGLYLPMTAAAEVSSPFGVCLDGLCSKRRDGALRIVGSAGRPANASEPVSLELDVPASDGTSRQFSVKAGDQDPVVIASATPAKQTLVITAYYLYAPRERSLSLLAGCVANAPKSTDSN